MILGQLLNLPLKFLILSFHMEIIVVMIGVCQCLFLFVSKVPFMFDLLFSDALNFLWRQGIIKGFQNLLSTFLNWLTLFILSVPALLLLWYVGTQHFIFFLRSCADMFLEFVHFLTEGVVLFVKQPQLYLFILLFVQRTVLLEVSWIDFLAIIVNGRVFFVF